MTKADLIKYIRTNVIVGEPLSDSLLVLSDSDIELYLSIVISRDYSRYTLDNLPYECIYPVVLLTKIELYYYLATSVAHEYNISSDDGSLYRDQKYRHYMDMITTLRSLYNDFVEEGGTGKNTITASDVTLASRNHTERNYRLTREPSVEIVIDQLTDSTAELSLYVTCDSFSSMSLYLSPFRILDAYSSSELPQEYLIATFTDPHLYKTRLSNLTKLTNYYLTVAVKDSTSLIGYNDKSFTTLDEAVEEIVIP